MTVKGTCRFSRVDCREWYHSAECRGSLRSCSEGGSRPRAGPTEPRGTRGPPRYRTIRGDSCSVVARLLPRTPDPDMALNNLERLLAQPAAREQLAATARVAKPRARCRPPLARHLAVLRRHARGLPRVPRHRSATRRGATRPRRNSPANSRAEVAARRRRRRRCLRAFRRFRHRHTLRIGINDVIRDRPLEEVTRELVATGGFVHRGRAAARAAHRDGAIRHPDGARRAARHGSRRSRSASSAATS